MFHVVQRLKISLALSGLFHHHSTSQRVFQSRTRREEVRTVASEAEPIRLSMQRFGFLNMSDRDYIELLDWTARVVVPGKCGSTPPDAPPIFERLNLGISPKSWCELIKSFGKLFSTVAGKPHIVERYRSSRRKQKFTLEPKARLLLTV
jgi:hypothetical protein